MQPVTIKPDYTSIANVIREINDKKLLLPEFQRKFIWNIEQCNDLFDSIVRGIFIGAFVLAKPQFDLSCREIETRPRTGNGSRAKVDSKFFKTHDFEAQKVFVVLDGQQRITSLYRVLKGIDKLYFVFKKPDDLPNPTVDKMSTEQLIESISFKRIPENLCVELSDIYRVGNWKDKEIRKEIFDKISNEYVELENNEGLKERYFDLLLDLKRLFNQLIEDKTLLSVFFLNMDLEKFCMFFERSNSRGTELNFIDIITAKIYKDFNLDTKIKAFKEKHKGVLFDDTIVEAFVRYICFIKNKKVDRKTILNSLDGTDFIDYWNEICEMYVKTNNFLISQRLIMGPEWIPYKTMFIPMIHFGRNLPNKDFSQLPTNQATLFKFWFWASLLNTRYGGGMVGSTNDIIVEDCILLDNISKNKGLDKATLRTFKFKFEFEDILNLSSPGAIFTGIMSIIHYKNGFKNLGNNLNVDFKQKIDVHHVFPKDYLQSNFDEESFENENADSILNKMLIEKIPNIKFGKKAPSFYLNEVPLNQNPNIQDSLNSHLIPNPSKLINGEYDKNFKQFLTERFELIKNIIDSEVTTVKSNLLSELERPS